MVANGISSGNQYLQDQGPPTLDSKKSPLAMLVQTCSQIGMEGFPPSANGRKGKGAAAGTSTPPMAKKSPSPAALKRPRSRSNCSSVASSSGSSSNSTAASNPNASPPPSKRASSKEPACSPSVQVRSGLEVLHLQGQGHGQLGQGQLSSSSGSLPVPPLHHPSLSSLPMSMSDLATAAYYQQLQQYQQRLHYLSAGASLNPNHYLLSAKLPCKDPYCSAGGMCSSASMYPVPPSSAHFAPSSYESQSKGHSQGQHQQGVNVCNWVVGGDTFCGERFQNSEELLQHLRTHTHAASSGPGGLMNQGRMSMSMPTYGPPSYHNHPLSFPPNMGPYGGQKVPSAGPPYYSSPLGYPPLSLFPPNRPF